MKFCPVCDAEFDSGDTCPEDGTVLIFLKPKVDPLLGATLKGAYHIEEKIGEGGMGTVYRAVQQPLGRDVAIKVLNTQDIGTDNPIKRFYREAKLLSTLSHPNIVSLIDFGNTDEGLVFFVMEHLKGQHLGQIVPERKPLPIDDVVDLMDQICTGVGAAHVSGLIHRDIKPANIVLAETSDGSELVKVLDFGIAKSGGKGASRLTKTGAIVGTVGYIAPEVITGEAEASVFSDTYSLGAIFYFILTGNCAYDGPSTQSIIYKQLTEPPAPLDFYKFGYPDSFKEVVLKAMSIDPAHRYRTATELAAEIRVASYEPVLLPVGSGGILDVAEGAAATPQQDSDDALITQGSIRAFNMTQETETVSKVEASVEKSGVKKRLVLFGGLAALLAVLAAGAWYKGFFATPEKQEQVAALDAVRGVTPERVVIGMSAAFSGATKELGRAMRLGVETGFRAANDAGGIHGRTLHLTAVDDGYEPTRAADNVAMLFSKHTVFALLANMGTPTAKNALPLAMKKKALLFGAFTGADFLEKDPPDRYVFNFRPRYSQEIDAIVRYLVEVNHIDPAAIALFVQDDSYGETGVRAAKKALRHHKHPDPDKLLVGRYTRNTVEVDAAVQKIYQHRHQVKAVILVGTYRPSARFVRDMRSRGADPLFVSLSFVGAKAFAEELVENSPQYAQGIIVTQVVPHFASEATGVRRYRQLLQKYSPEESPGFTSLEGYVVATIFAEGIRRAGPSLTTESLIDTFEQMKDFDLGIGAICSFGPSRHQCSDKVWGTILDQEGHYQVLDLESPLNP